MRTYKLRLYYYGRQAARGLSMTELRHCDSLLLVNTHSWFRRRDDHQMFVQQIATVEVKAVGMPAGLALSDESVRLAPEPFEARAITGIAVGRRDIRDLPAGGTRP